MMKKKGFMCLLAAATLFGGCEEVIEESSRYTFVGHTVASFLEENEEIYGDFIEILRRGDRLSLMKAYGQYTCFAPTNDAITRYLKEQDSIYWTTLEEGNPVWTGITSPELSELSDSMCRVISQTHIIPDVYLSTDMEGDIIPTMNMNDRYLSLSYGVDESNRYELYINGSSEIIAKDEEVENGVVHTIASVLNPSTNTLPAQIEEHDYFRIMAEAITATGYIDKLQLHKDEDYNLGDLSMVDIYQRTQIPYPANRYYGYSAFLEPDTVFYAAGIRNLEELKEACKEWYPNATDSDPMSPDNALNQFVGYHLMNRNLAYSRLVCYKIKTHSVVDSEQDFLDGSDRYEFYETMSGKLMKITMPRSVAELQSTILLNYYKPREGETVPQEAEAYMNTKVYDPNEFRDMDGGVYANFSANALNGTIHPINKILVYNEDVMVGRVLNTIIRFDASAICPELTNNNMRWHFFAHAQASDIGEFYIPNSYCDNMKVLTEETRTYYLPPHVNYHNYQGDEMNTLGAYDFALRLPHVPAGTYEIRMGYTPNERRGIVQIYLDNEVTGIPVDVRVKGSDPSIGFEADANTDDNGIQNDKEMKNRGFLKASTTYVTTGSNIARHQSNVIRRVITTKYLGEGDHWLRFKNAYENDNGTAQFMYDYFELVPISYIRDESISIEEKRQ